MSISGLARTNSSQPANSGDSEDCIFYDVLYSNRRKNKKSQVDGLLKVARNGTITLTDTTEVDDNDDDDDDDKPSSKPTTKSYVYQGRQKELATKAFEGGSGLQIDDTIIVGPYEAEILSVNFNSSTKGSTNSKSTLMSMKQKKMTARQQPQQSKLHARPLGGGMSSKLKQIQRKPLHPRSNSSSGSFGGSVPLSSNRRISSLKAKTSTVKNAAKDEESASSDDDEQHVRPPQHVKPKIASSLLKRKFTSPILGSLTVKKQTTQHLKKGAPVAASRRPLLSKKTTTKMLPSSKQTSLVAAKGQKRKLDNTTSSTVSATMTSRAINDIDIPNSVRTSLKLHQEEGVEFLWKCLTGLGNARPYNAPGNPVSLDNQNVLKGCILGDCMGSGKSLMTIAVICALYRQRRDSVRAFVH